MDKTVDKEELAYHDIDRSRARTIFYSSLPIQLTTQRAQLRAHQSSISIAQSNIASLIENFRGAESKIRDADIADDVVKLTKHSMLQQAAIAIQAQTNFQPRLVLELLS